jgi:8-oxo-dGTP pyrophosphatase MutT (NUDIX family)
MLVRDAAGSIEVFMARRSARSAFMPDAYVFPGGALDAGDASPAAVALLDAVPAGVEAPFAITAIRELLEEAGVLLGHRPAGDPPTAAAIAAMRAELAAGAAFAALLQRDGWRIEGSALTYYSRWITPPGEMARRFDARFFTARAPANQAAAADAFELHDGAWTTPADAIARFERNEWSVAYPTLRHLERLAAFDTVDALVENARSRTPVAVMPNLARDGGIALPAELADW